MICKNCGEEIGWYARGHEHGQTLALVHAKTGRDLCHRATFAEPEETERQRDIEMLRGGLETVCITEHSQALYRTVIRLAEAEASRPSCPPTRGWVGDSHT